MIWTQWFPGEPANFFSGEHHAFLYPRKMVSKFMDNWNDERSFLTRDLSVICVKEIIKGISYSVNFADSKGHGFVKNFFFIFA